MTYARARLWVGICGVGTMVCAAVAILTLDVPKSFASTDSVRDSLTLFSAFIGGYVLLASPFDWLGGWILPRRFGRVELSLGRFTRQWLWGVACHALLILVAASLLLLIARAWGATAGVATVVAIGLVFFAFQLYVGRLLAPFHMEEHAVGRTRLMHDLRELGYDQLRIKFARSLDPGFTGGISGLPGLETIILPSHWLTLLSASQQTALAARRAEAIASGSRLRSLISAAAWNLTGVIGVLQFLPGAGLQTGPELITTSCGLTLWSFLGLLILPTFSRRAATALDEAVTSRGVATDDLQAALKAIDRMQDDEPTRSPLVETIFHPVPSLTRRGERSETIWPAWHLARMTLCCSWIALGLLGRSVHCNAGRTDLWVLLPTD